MSFLNDIYTSSEKLMTDIALLVTDYHSNSLPDFWQHHKIFCIISAIFVVLMIIRPSTNNFGIGSIKTAQKTVISREDYDKDRKRKDRDYRI